MATEQFDPYHKWLAIPPSEQPPNHYRLLALPLFENDPDVISDAAEQRMAHVRTYQLGERSELSQKILNELAAARVCLLNLEKKATYDAELRSKFSTPAEPHPVAPPIQAHPSKPAPFPLVGQPSLAGYHATPLTRKQQPWLIPLAIAAAVVVVIGLLAIVLSSGGKEEAADSKSDGGSRSKAATKESPAKSPIKPIAAVEKKPDVQPPREKPKTPTVVEKTPEPKPPIDVPKSEPPTPSTPVNPPTPTEPTEPTKLPVPSDAAQEQVLALIREVYKDDFAAAKTPEQKATLASKLIEKAAETNDDPASRFVLLKVARDLASQAGHLDVAFGAINWMALYYDIDARQMKLDALTNAKLEGDNAVSLALGHLASGSCCK